MKLPGREIHASTRTPLRPRPVAEPTTILAADPADGGADASPRTVLARRELLLVAGVSTLVASVALGWFFQHGVHLAYSDAISHLIIARRVLDSRTPGLAQLGTVWLPVPHLLMQPFIYSNLLWHTGLAGSLVGLLSFVVTAVALFVSIRLITRHRAAAWIGLAVFLSNPNALYLQTTALTEPVLLASMTAAGCFLLLWSRTGRYQLLLIAGLLAAMAVGCRYDGWAFSLVSAALVLASSYLGSRDAAKAEGSTLAYLAIPMYAMFLWLFYNWAIFGDVLEFARGEYSAAYQQEQIAKAGGLPTKGDILLSGLAYSWAVVDNLGWLVVAMSAAGLLAYVFSTRFRPGSLITYAFLASYLFNILSLWLGQTIVVTPHSDPPGYFNVRYGIVVLPAAVLFVGYLGDCLIRQVGLVAVAALAAIALGAQLGSWLPEWPTSVVTVADGLVAVSARSPLHQAARYLHTQYSGGGVLIDDTNTAFFMFDSGLAMREYIGTFSGELWKGALANPAGYVEWVVIRPGSPDDRVANRINRHELDRLYDVVFQSDQIVLYRRKGH